MRRLEGEDGTVAVMVAMMLVVFLGIGALVVDAGNLYWERRQLQNAADAAAFSAAQELAPGGSEGAALVFAQEYANANNSRGAFVRPTEFVTTPTSVSVTARTGDIGAEGELQSFLAGVLGVDTYATSARATVDWDQNVGSGITIPIALCVENWNFHTNNGSVLPSGPPPHIIRFASGPHANIEDQDCGNPGVPGNNTYPGGFGFLNRNDDCMAVSFEEGLFPGTTGNNPIDNTSSCSVAELYALLQSVIDNGQEVLIPIFYDWQGAGNNGEFKVIGYGGFLLQGYDFRSAAEGNPHDRSYGMHPSECQGAGAPNCLKGYYTRFVALGGEASTGSGPGFGATLLRLIE
jgi:Flp pilus assembly protein TadG